MTDPDLTFRARNADGTVTEVQLTPAQGLDLDAGQPIGYAPHDEKVLMEEDGTIVFRESARPIEDAA